MTSLTLVRHIRARPAIVFDALTTPEGVASWWGPDEDGEVLVAETDPREGGSFRVRFRRADGSEHESCGEYLELSPDRVRMSWRWTFGGTDRDDSLIEVQLRPAGEGTEMVFTHSRLRDEQSRAAHEAGWIGSLNKLERRFKDAAPETHVSS
jgi:uncharacterized protein YndB with AHSA1/START domain